VAVAYITGFPTRLDGIGECESCLRWAVLVVSGKMSLEEARNEDAAKLAEISKRAFNTSRKEKASRSTGSVSKKHKYSWIYIRI